MVSTESICSRSTSWEFNWMQALCLQNNRDERRFLSKSQSGAPSNQKPPAEARTFCQTLRSKRNHSLSVLGGSDWIVDIELLISELESLHKIWVQENQTHGAFYGQLQTPYKNSLYTFATAEASLPSGVLTPNVLVPNVISTHFAKHSKSTKSRNSNSSVQYEMGARRRGSSRRCCRVPSG